MPTRIEVLHCASHQNHRYAAVLCAVQMQTHHAEFLDTFTPLQAQQHTFNMPYQLSHPSFIENPDSATCAGLATLEVYAGDIIIVATDGMFDNLFDTEVLQLVADSLVLPSLRVGLLPTNQAASLSKQQSFGGSAGSAASLSTDFDSFQRIMSAFGGWLGGAKQEAADAAAGVAEMLPYTLYGRQHAEALAASLAKAAHTHAADPRRCTPWSVSLSEQGFRMSRGAKNGGKMDDCTVVIAMVVA